MQGLKSKIAGLPYPIILFLIVATLPALYSDHLTRNDVKRVDLKVQQLQNEIVVVKPTPTLTVTPTATPSATPVTTRATVKFGSPSAKLGR